MTLDHNDKNRHNFTMSQRRYSNPNEQDQIQIDDNNAMPRPGTSKIEGSLSKSMNKRQME